MRQVGMMYSAYWWWKRCWYCTVFTF